MQKAATLNSHKKAQKHEKEFTLRVSCVFLRLLLLFGSFDLVHDAVPDNGHRAESKEGFEAWLLSKDLLELAAFGYELNHRKLVVRVV